MRDWKKEAEEWALERFDYIINKHITKDFIEFYASIGGERVTYRYYKTGVIAER